MKQEPRTRTGTLVGILIVLCWVVVMGYYLGRQACAGRGPSPVLGLGTMPGDQEVWMGLYLREQKIGYNHLLFRAGDKEHLVLDEARFNIKLMNQPQKVHIRAQARLAADFTIRWIKLEGLQGILNFSAEGEARGNSLVLDARAAGEEITREVIPFSEPPVFYTPWLLTERLAAEGLEVGKTIRLTSFETMTRQAMPVTLEVEAEETLTIHGQERKTFRVKETMAGQSDYLWVSKEGDLLKQAHASGFTALRETKEQALSGWDEEAAVDLIAALVVKSNTAVINPRQVVMMRGRLKNISLAGLDLISDGQSAAGDLITVHAGRDLPEKGYALPISEELLAAHPELEPYLASEPLVQKDDPAIIQAAQPALAEGREAVAAARALTSLVSKMVEDTMVITLPSALSVLEQKKGSCKEHTILYVALARSLGIPARMNAGLVYADTEQLLEGFYYHAWPEVWLADERGERGRWVAVDPTFNQFPADATHIRLKEGGLDKALDLLGVVGQVEVEIEEYQ